MVLHYISTSIYTQSNINNIISCERCKKIGDTLRGRPRTKESIDKMIETRRINKEKREVKI